MKEKLRKLLKIKYKYYFIKIVHQHSPPLRTTVLKPRKNQRYHEVEIWNRSHGHQKNHL